MVMTRALLRISDGETGVVPISLLTGPEVLIASDMGAAAVPASALVTAGAAGAVAPLVSTFGRNVVPVEVDASCPVESGAIS